MYMNLTENPNSSIMVLPNNLEVTTMVKKTNSKAATVAESKTEIETAPVKETAAEAPAEKPAKKPPAKKTATKANAPANAAEKKTPVKSKTAAKLSDPKETVKVQFGGEEFDFANIKKAVEADYKSKFKGKVKTIEIYIKPEDKAAYYVINGDFSDKVEL